MHRQDSRNSAQNTVGTTRKKVYRDKWLEIWLTNESNKVYKIRLWVNVSCIASPIPVFPPLDPAGLDHPRDAFLPFCRVKVARNDLLGVPEEEI